MMKIPESVRGQLDSMFRLGLVGDLSDGELLDRVGALEGEPAEAAFALLVERHGPMVFRVCRDSTGNRHDAEDACQAVFLVLARKAGSVRRRESAAGWLFGVARKVSSRARRDASRRRRHERLKAERAGPSYLEADRFDSWEELYEEIDRLPESHRSAVVLCHLEGLTHEEAATRLRCPLRTLQSRLLRARARLRDGLARRGVAPGAGALALLGRGAISSSLSAKLAGLTVRVALSRSPGVVPAAVSSLAEGVLSMSTSTKLVHAMVALMTIGAAAGIARALGSGPGPAREGLIEPTVLTPGVPPAADPDDPTGKIEARGIVVDEAGRPVANAEVLVEAFTDREVRRVTAEDGSFSVPTRSEGAKFLARSAEGRTRGVSRRNPDSPGGPIRITLKPARKVAVRVVDAAKAPIPGALVRAHASGFQFVEGGTTDAEGWLPLAIPVDSSVESIFALKPGRGFDYAEFGPIDGARRPQGGAPASEIPENVTLSIDAARSVKVRAVDLDDKPLAGVAFTPWLVHKEGRLSQINLRYSRAFLSTTNADGEATFDWLPPSRDAVVFWPRAEGYAHRRAVLPEGQAGPVIARMIRNETIRGRVVRPDGSPAMGVRILADGTGQGRDSGRSRGTTRFDGSYVLDVPPGEAYAVYVEEEGGWTATPRFDVIVRRGFPAGSVDFELSRGTVIRGTVTTGPDHAPAPGRYIGLRQSGGRPLADFLDQGTNGGPEVYRYLHAKADAEGRYSARVTPGDYSLIVPTFEEFVDLKVGTESEIVRDFWLQESGPVEVAGRVIEGSTGRPLAGAKVTIVPINGSAVPLIVKADAEGKFRASRPRCRLVIHALGDDGRLGSIVEVAADVIDVVIPLAPTANATGLLLDGEGQPVANRPIEWGRRVLTSDTRKGWSSLCFASDVSTDGAGRFTLPSIVVGQAYEVDMRKGDQNFPAGSVRPQVPGPFDSGTLRVQGFRP